MLKSSTRSTFFKRSLIMGWALLCVLSLNIRAQNTMTIEADHPQNKISRHIYGQFSEHLGTGIYGGLWVGEDSDIPNTKGFRNDVVKALQELEIPNLRWPGRSEEHTSELQSRFDLVCRLLLEKKKN